MKTILFILIKKGKIMIIQKRKMSFYYVLSVMQQIFICRRKSSFYKAAFLRLRSDYFKKEHFNKHFRYFNLQWVFLTVLLFLSVKGFSQHTNVKVGDGFTGWPLNEPSIFISRMNTDNMVVGTNPNYYFSSIDGGLTWSMDTISSSYRVFCDPCIISDKNGYFYYFHIGVPTDKIICQKLTQIGGDWTNGSYTGLNGDKDQDKEWAVVDFNNNNIYVTWTQFDKYGSKDSSLKSNIMFSRSIDNGESWSTAVQINEVPGDCRDDDNTVEGAVPAVGPNGEVYVSWAGPEGIVFDRSLDYGDTWLENDIHVSDIPGGWSYDIPGILPNWVNGFPVTSCDISNGQHRGTIYINWSDQRNGEDDTDIWVSKSIDGGDTWSDPIRVNDDPPGHHQYYTWMDIDQTNGIIYVVFYDRRNFNDNHNDVYLAVSKDGGETFVNFKISDTPFLTENNVFLGDYTNISAHNNVIRPVWIRKDDNLRSVWTAIIKPELLTGINNRQYGTNPENFEIVSVYPNPFNASTKIKFNIPESGKVTLKIYNVLGKEIRTLFNGYQNKGTHDFFWNAANNNGIRVNSGLFLIKLSYRNAADIKKIVLLK